MTKILGKREYMINYITEQRMQGLDSISFHILKCFEQI